LPLCDVISQRTLLVAAALVALSVGCSPLPTRHSPVARVGGRLAHQARRADALGLTPAAAHAMGSARVGDLVRAIGAIRRPEDRTSADGESVEPTADQAWARDLAKEHRHEIDDSYETAGSGATYFQPVSEARVRALYVEEPFSTYNEQGREFHDGLNLYMSDRAVVRLVEHVVFTAEPEFSVVQNSRTRQSPGDDEDYTLRFQELALSTRFGFAEMTVGRTPLWWGPGRHGALLVSNNARPFDLIKLGTAGPQLLPGWLGYLGHVQAETFVARMETDRAVSEPYIWGLRVSTRLNPWIEFGASRTAQFGGRGRAVGWGTVRDVVLADTENDPGDPGNQLASLDVRFVLPFPWQPLELYAEVGGEDEAGGFFSKTAWLAGVYLPRIGPWNQLELTVEVADTKVSGSPGVWYSNRHYPDGYTYHEQVIGHHLGADGLDIFSELRLHPTSDVEVFASFGFEEHFRQSPVRERVYQVRAGVEARVWRRLWLHLVWGIDLWRNFRQVDGDDEVGHGLGVGARWTM